MFDLRSAPSENASIKEIVRYSSYLREQILYLYDSQYREIQTLKSEIAQIKNAVADLTSEIAQIKNDIADLKEDVEELKTQN